MAVAFDAYNQATSDITHTLRRGTGSSGDAIPQTISGMRVRRLTPRECERLQGFPDDYTLVPNRGKPAADGPRYKALGNSMAVPVMRWIGERIAKMEALS
jgi:DNA (cytosine-5)-methyltransferase 1